ncbi:Phospholipase D1 [Nymphon striatum]|nr:Phospholipase D1 [Nymphon striatum]
MKPDETALKFETQESSISAHTHDSEYETLALPTEDEDGSTDQLSFTVLHDDPLAFKSPHREVLIPHVDINVRITEVTYTASNLLNPYLYVIQLQHGNFEWTIKKRYKHFHHLHQQLRIFRTAIKIPIPTKKHRERRKSVMHDKSKKVLPRFPKRPEALINAEKVELRRHQLEEYIKNLLKIPVYKYHYETLEFLEISNLSFVGGLGSKGKEGLIKKRSGGHRVQTGCLLIHRLFWDWCSQWKKRWLVIKDSFVAYISPQDGRIKAVLLMDQDFEVKCGLLHTGIHHGLLMSNATRHLLVKCWTKRKAREWAQYMVTTAKTTAQDFTRPNRYNSYAPVRMDTECRWFIDGATYMEAVADVLESAKEEIFICDWWLSPEIYLKRPSIEGDTWRLDKILQRKAHQGVRIYILLYKEVELALGINSIYSKQKLISGQYRNIKVLRHPDHAPGGILLWAHHEKIVCVDQKYAFLGGIDLCYGRWDDYHHRLTDLGGIGMSRNDSVTINSSAPKGTPVPSRKNSRTYSDGADGKYKSAFDRVPSLSIMASISNIPADVVIQWIPSHVGIAGNEKANYLAKTATCLGPIQVQMTSLSSYLGKISSSNSEVWHLRWGYQTMGRSYFSIQPKPNLNKYHNLSRQHQTIQAFKTHRRRHSIESINSLNMGMEEEPSTGLDVPSNDLKRTNSEQIMSDLGVSGTMKLWHGKDYCNFIVKDFVALDLPYQDLVDRHVTPRMPWHDIGVMVTGIAARDVARHFIQRWNFTKLEKAKYHNNYPWLLPKTDNEDSPTPPLPFSRDKMFCGSCQILRSVGQWSAGVKYSEESIHNAYVDAIHNAQHFIYIENQFFITQPNGSKDVTNEISEALYRRVIKAHQLGETFRIYVVMPLLPAFEGEIGTNNGTAIQAITHWNYASICRGENSLLQRLAREVGDPTQYVSFYGLRTHDVLNDKLVTELVYVHSKMMIVDDIKVIIGSANINDRSLIGRRDSEIAVIVKDSDTEMSLMNGKEFEAGRFACSLRRTLFREHLGLLKNDSGDIDVRDPICDDFFKNIWVKIAATNTSVYEKLALALVQLTPYSDYSNSVLGNEVHSFTNLKVYQTKVPLAVSDPETSKELLKKVKGHLVLLPMHFLCMENLTPAVTSKEILMPTSLWT